MLDMTTAQRRSIAAAIHSRLQNHPAFTAAFEIFLEDTLNTNLKRIISPSEFEQFLQMLLDKECLERVAVPERNKRTNVKVYIYQLGKAMKTTKTAERE